MVIEINDECMTLLKEEKYINFFNDLVCFINNGRHYVFLSKKFLEMLYKNDKINKRAQMTYKKLFDSSCEDFIVKNSISRIIKITKNTEIKRVNGVISMSLDRAIDIDLFNNKINLICENMTDCNFFIALGEIYKNNNSIVGESIQLEKCPGGGSTIYDICMDKKESRKFSVAFVDSDRKYKNGPIGNTLKRIREEINDKYNEIYELNVHEIENLIPIQMIENYYKYSKGEADKSEVIGLLKSIKSKVIDEMPLAYYDMKNGIKREKWENDDNYKAYWESELKRVGYSYGEQGDIAQGFGPYFFRKLFAYMNKERENGNFYEENVDEYMRKEWNEIGCIVYSYGCARKRVCFF